MSLPDLLEIPAIHRRLERLFPEGLETRRYLVREMTAKAVFVFLYGGMVEGTDRRLRPSHIYFFTEEQASSRSAQQREDWFTQSAKPGFRPAGVRWYADTTREPIRDETIRFGLLNIGAVGKTPGVAVTSSTPIYFLKADFAAIFDPAVDGHQLEGAIAFWQKKHLSASARARMALLAAGALKNSDEVVVNCPNGSVARLSSGPSSLISKAVVEEFAARFLTAPALLWLSESGAKVRYQDDQIAKALGLAIDQSKVLPDIILANIGASGDDTHLVFVEVVASDGAMTQARRDDLLQYVIQAGFPQAQCQFGTAFEDRAHGAFKKTIPELAWGTFVWFRSEPDCLMWLYDEPITLTAGRPG